MTDPASAARTPLSGGERQRLRARAHHLRPVVMLGAAGITPAVLAELDAALAHHELVKIKLGGMDREQRREAAAELCAGTGAQLVQMLGQMAVLYRARPE